jgi:hypothetical protein
MTSLRRRLTRLALALGVAALCWACNAPFIPVPPPQTVTFTSALVADDAGTTRTVWVAHGPAYPYAALHLAYVFDVNFGAGVIAEVAGDGSFTSPPMDGNEGDHVEISFETAAGALTPSVCFQLTTAVQSTPNGPSAPLCPTP